MIQLPIISQEKYIINNDTIIGYTPSENRSIALLFLEGDMYKELYFNEAQLSSYKDSIIQNQKYNILFLDSSIVIQNRYLNDLNILNNNLNIEVNKIKSKNKNKRNIIIGSVAINIALILTLFVK